MICMYAYTQLIQLRTLTFNMRVLSFFFPVLFPEPTFHFAALIIVLTLSLVRNECTILAMRSKEEQDFT